MKILRIAGKNLASLADEFSVDFTQHPLSEAGLFAISGPTGAGKSTLLDALCLALYDDTPRVTKAVGKTPDTGDTISAQDPRTLLRRGASEGWAEVDFVGNDGQSYRARWKVRRARSKAAGALQPTAMALCRLPDLQPLGHTKTEVMAEIAQRIGLSFEQFTRSVLLAQNEFATFLRAADDERGALLETLTGSAVYSDISRRAFERWRSEEGALKQLTAGLASQQPLPDEERAALLAQAAAADTAHEAIVQRMAGLEADLRWHQQAERLTAGVQQARELGLQKQQEHAAAEARRATLAQLDAVQAARPLHDEVERLTGERAATQAALAQAEQEAERTRLALTVLAGDMEQAAAQLAAAEAAQLAAAAQLDQAKALDARLHALQAALAQAASARDAATQSASTAHAALQAREAQQQQLAQQQEIGAAWLAQHAPWAPLARDWARWDVLFHQAGQQAARAEQQSQALAGVLEAAQRQRHDEQAARSGQQQAAERLHAAEAQRAQAQAALAAIDADALLARRQQLELRRNLLGDADKTWHDLAQRLQRRQELVARVATLQAARATAEAEAAQARQTNLQLVAASTQAERALKVAEAATAESVEHLRAALEDGAPCPVCGATEHPYRHAQGPLQAMLAQLQADVQACRDQLQHNIELEARLGAQVQVQIEQLAAIGSEQHALDEALAALQPRWQAASTALAMPQLSDDSVGAWLQEQQAAQQASWQAQEAQEQALRHAQRTREVAQTACDQASAEHARQQQALAAAQAALVQSAAQQQALEAQRIDTALQIGALLDELDGVMQRPGWQDEWKDGPARFYEQRARESRQWQAQSSACEERSATLATLAVELHALRSTQERCAAEAQAAQAAHAAALAACDGAAGERRALFEGRPVQEVEAALRTTQEQARATLQARRESAQQAAQQRTRAEEAFAHQRQRLTTLNSASEAAQARLQDWLAGQHAPGVSTLEQLRALLAHPQQAIRDERSALQVLEQALASAQAVLAEREAQLAAHQASAAPSDPRNAAQLQAALESALSERQQAHAQAAALRLQLAQDDARREAAQALLADIAQQQQVERRWAQLNELIGSADGKKFRNYAQQFTLDVLLGYANAHLAQLAPRYQLERINHPAQPSLGLLVRDLHMGDELRSVHSLSGGESFLVSLAMALGLASLSSNRVRVESLFIDEGFGSLDADTLRVAMDALDGLQAMGRKVGIISHVQEMTERIATRILVQPAAQGRSVVSVS